MANNTTLNIAKEKKYDEFYTQLSDIEKELSHYKHYFEGKTVFCNCDDPDYSNFWKYFYLNFDFLGLKKLIATHYEEKIPSYKLEFDGDTIKKTALSQNGDFRSPECVELLKTADIIVTNPPFSLFREYIAQLMEYDKKFIIIGNMNAIHYKEVFPLIRDNKLWVGYKKFSGGMDMIFPSENFDASKVKKYSIDEQGRYIVNIMGVIWYTNLDIQKRHEEIILYKAYDPDYYPSYDNFDGIDVKKVSEIPYDYSGYMGVPDTFMENYNPDQFEIIGLSTGDSAKEIGIKKNYRGRTDLAYTENGKSKCPFSRIIIRRKYHEN